LVGLPCVQECAFAAEDEPGTGSSRRRAGPAGPVLPGDHGQDGTAAP
jgi:hypothetical protein